jgi:hypothetical protein
LSGFVDLRTFLTEGGGVGGIGLDERDRFIAELRKRAKAGDLAFRVEKRCGKGGHAMVWVGDRVTTLPPRAIDPKTARKILKALGLV